MTLADVLRAIRARWLLFAVCCVIPLAAGFAVVHLSAPVYSSTAELYVAPAGSTSVGPNRYQGFLLAQQEAASYVPLVNSPAVMAAVVADLHLSIDPDQLAGQVSAMSSANSVLIQVTAHASSAALARAIANDTATQLAGAAERLARGDEARNPPVRVTLVKPATLQPEPISPHETTDRALGLVVGLVVGLVAVIVREKTDRRVRTVQQAQSSSGCSLVTPIAGDRGSAWWWPGRHPGPTPDSFTAESFRRLRLCLAPVMAPRHVQSLAVASLKEGALGPAVAANLALALAEGGSKVVLVDADGRAGLIADYFDVDDSQGVSTVVGDEVPLISAIQPYRENLFIVPAGPARFGAPRVSLAELARLLVRLGEITDHIVVNVGPILDHAAAAELSAAADGVLLVVQKDKAKQEELRLGTEMLRSGDADLVGVVLVPAHLEVMPSAFRTARPGPDPGPPAGANGRSTLVRSGLARPGPRVPSSSGEHEE
jgi:capsular polysaccharide biosynthesis protein/Mrp family chromosome partitioning ATPase